MTSFAIEPDVGPLPLRFGMTPFEVEQIVGKPLQVLNSYFGDRGEARAGFQLGFSQPDQHLDEAVFTPDISISLYGHDLFHERDLIATLRQFDPHAYLFVGFVVFPGLGIRLSGFHDGDEPQKAIAVVRFGHWDKNADLFVPFEQ